MEEIMKLVMTGGSGVAALAFVFWMLIKELPEQRKTRELMMASHQKQIDDLIKGNQSHVETLMTNFRSELAIERESCRQERILDREARHAMASVLNTNNLAILEMSQNFPESFHHSVAKVLIPTEQQSNASSKGNKQ